MVICKKPNPFKKADQILSLNCLVRGVSHEVNTPLGNCITLITYIEKQSIEMTRIMERSNATESELLSFSRDMQESSMLLKENLNKINKLMEGFRALSTENADCSRVPIDIFELVWKCYQQNEFRGSKDIKMTILMEDRLVFEGDYHKTKRVLTELFNNAFQHGFEQVDQGQIEVRISSLQDVYRITFWDNGKGIGTENLERVCMPFYSSKFSGKNRGLGLSVAYSLVKSMNGNIKIGNHRKGGTLVDFSLSRKTAFLPSD